MNKFVIVAFLFFVSVFSVNAQQESKEKSIVEHITDKKYPDKYKLYLFMQSRLNFNFDSTFKKSEFQMKDIRFALDGKINSWLSFAYQQRLYRHNNGENNVDILPASIDIAGIGIELRKNIGLFLGKQCAAYGGIEFDAYPHEVYEFSDMGDFMTCYMTGAKVVWEVNKSNELQFQILNSLVRPFSETYGNIPDVKESKLPFVYSLNWNSNYSFANLNLITRWSATVMNEAKHKNMYYFAFGNNLSKGKWNVYLDALYSLEDIDRKGVITAIVNKNKKYQALNAEYLSFILKIDCKIADKWAVFTKGMYETASVAKHYDKVEKGKYYTSLGYLAGIEFYPIKDSNLHFFASYTGRSYLYTNKSVDFRNIDKHRVSLGFIYSMPIL